VISGGRREEEEAVPWEPFSPRAPAEVAMRATGGGRGAWYQARVRPSPQMAKCVPDSRENDSRVFSKLSASKSTPGFTAKDVGSLPQALTLPSLLTSRTRYRGQRTHWESSKLSRDNPPSAAALSAAARRVCVGGAGDEAERGGGEVL